MLVGSEDPLVCDDTREPLKGGRPRLRGNHGRTQQISLACYPNLAPTVPYSRGHWRMTKRVKERNMMANILLGDGGVATLCLFLAVFSLAIVPAAAQSSPNNPTTTGAAVFGKWCSDCHGRPDGPGTRALERRYGNSERGLLEQRIDLTPEFVEYVARHGLGFMPPFRKTEISDSELKAVADYLSQKQK